MDAVQIAAPGAIEWVTPLMVLFIVLLVVVLVTMIVMAHATKDLPSKRYGGRTITMAERITDCIVVVALVGMAAAFVGALVATTKAGTAATEGFGIVESPIPMEDVLRSEGKTFAMADVLVRDDEGNLTKYEAVEFLYQDGTVTMTPVDVTIVP